MTVIIYYYIDDDSRWRCYRNGGPQLPGCTILSYLAYLTQLFHYQLIANITAGVRMYCSQCRFVARRSSKPRSATMSFRPVPRSNARSYKRNAVTWWLLT